MRIPIELIGFQLNSLALRKFLAVDKFRFKFVELDAIYHVPFTMVVRFTESDCLDSLANSKILNPNCCKALNQNSNFKNSESLKFAS